MTLASLVARRGTGHTSEIAATAFAYPSEVVDNDEYFRRCQFVPTTPRDQLIEETRMKTRRWCAPEENTRTLVESVVDSLHQKHPELVAEIDLVVVASGTTMPMAHPSDPDNRAFADLSPLVIQRLGLRGALGLDIKACYCTGFLRGLQVVDGMLSNVNYRAALLIAAEQGSRFATAASNRSSFCFIVSDAAGAMVLRRKTGAEAAGIRDYCGYTDAEKLDWVGIGDDAASITMLGTRAATATRDMLLECARTLLHRNGLVAADIDWLIPIQTHAGLLDDVSHTLGFSKDRVLWFGDVNGFSGSASIPACLAEQVERGTVRKNQLILSLAVGAGMNCAAALYHC